MTSITIPLCADQRYVLYIPALIDITSVFHTLLKPTIDQRSDDRWPGVPQTAIDDPYQGKNEKIVAVLLRMVFNQLSVDEYDRLRENAADLFFDAYGVVEDGGVDRFPTAGTDIREQILLHISRCVTAVEYELWRIFAGEFTRSNWYYPYHYLGQGQLLIYLPFSRDFESRGVTMHLLTLQEVETQKLRLSLDKVPKQGISVPQITTFEVSVNRTVRLVTDKPEDTPF